MGPKGKRLQKFFEKNSCFSKKTMLLYLMRLRNDPPWRKR